MDTFKIFIVEDDIWYSEILAYHLALNPDYEIKKFHTGEDCLDHLHENPSVITLDYTLPDLSGEAVLKKIKTLKPQIPVIMISGQESVEIAVSLWKNGAYDYIVKNDETKDRLWNTIRNVRENVNLVEKVEQLEAEVEKKYNFSNTIIGNSPAIQRTFKLIEKATKADIVVSVTGETGTGKELIAKAIHYNSKRKKKPFVAVNAAAIPKELIESELFGHEKGAFTGAAARRIGKFEEADKGTLFLDEIAEMDINMQAKLLRALQEGEITRIGGTGTVKFDARIIVATHKDLREEVKKGNFREDLYYRLLGLSIELPPLRERDEDILVLSKFFMTEFCKKNKLPKLRFTVEAQDKLMNYPYHGNVRELKAIIDLACVMADNDEIHPDDIRFRGGEEALGELLHQEMTLKQYERKIITHFLNKHNRDIKLVAKKLDIGVSSIYRMIKQEEIKLD
ncbi:MAG: sigma-54-dependent transcriptional regulator [Flammeovirgaceae bacterium]